MPNTSWFSLIVLSIAFIFGLLITIHIYELEGRNEKVVKESGEFGELMEKCLDNQEELSCLADLKIVADDVTYNNVRQVLLRK